MLRGRSALGVLEMSRPSHFTTQILHEEPTATREAQLEFVQRTRADVGQLVICLDRNVRRRPGHETDVDGLLVDGVARAEGGGAPAKKNGSSKNQGVSRQPKVRAGMRNRLKCSIVTRIAEAQKVQ